MRVKEVNNSKEECTFMPITKANVLIRDYRHRFFTSNEAKAIAYVCAQIGKKGLLVDVEEPIYEFKIVDFCRDCGIARGGKQYKLIEDTFKSIADKSVWHKDDADKKTLIRWFSRVVIDEGKGIIQCQISKDMVPFLYQLQNDYTSYDFFVVRNFKKESTCPLFELFKSYAFNAEEKNKFYVKEVSKTIDGINCIKQKISIRFEHKELVRYLGLVEFETYFNNSAFFKSNVIDKCIEEINKYSNLYVECNKEKKDKGCYLFVFDIYFDKTFVKKKEEGVF